MHGSHCLEYKVLEAACTINLPRSKGGENVWKTTGKYLVNIYNMMITGVLLCHTTLILRVCPAHAHVCLMMIAVL